MGTKTRFVLACVVLISASCITSIANENRFVGPRSTSVHRLFSSSLSNFTFTVDEIRSGDVTLVLEVRDTLLHTRWIGIDERSDGSWDQAFVCKKNQLPRDCVALDFGPIGTKQTYRRGSLPLPDDEVALASEILNSIMEFYKTRAMPKYQYT